MWTAGVLTGQCFSVLPGLLKLTTWSLIVLSVRQGVLSKEVIWSWFLLNKGGGNSCACYIFKDYTCHIKISERLLLSCVMALDYFGVIYSIIILCDPFFLSFPTTVPLCCELVSMCSCVAYCT